MNNALTLGTSAIREVDGLFSLNDLHAASGGVEHHRPSKFLSTKQAAELVGEIDKARIRALQQSPDSGFGKAGIPALRTTRGRHASTYACKELVIAYAAWISAAFHLKVIRVFLGTQPAASPAPAPAPQRPQPLRIEHDRKGITDDMRDAIQVRAMEIMTSALPSIHAWLTQKIKQGCIAPGGGPAPNFENTLVACDFAAFSTNWATKRLDSAMRLAEFAHAEIAQALANVAAERNRINKG